MELAGEGLEIFIYQGPLSLFLSLPLVDFYDHGLLNSGRQVQSRAKNNTSEKKVFFQWCIFALESPE